ncbi:MAG: hypothetical protein JW743_12615 [Deltaproteobacteria bacterium]|nr:hypothetical protein [Deltaproteobacteria bacterium]MBN2844785.1 hypothetical protein [Deltaproteobacteria bacterium]
MPLADLPAIEESEFQRKCEDISSRLIDVQCYLIDYRIELMNHILGEIFDCKVPERKPHDPKFKTLKEIAIPEEVEKQFKQMEDLALKGKLTVL